MRPWTPKPWLGPALVGLLLLLWPIGLPLTDGDTAYYARIAQRMVETGDWLTLRYPGSDALVDKPPLTIWFIALSYLLLGVNETAVRLWHILMSVGTVAVVQATADRFFPRPVTTFAGWILLTSMLFVYSAFVPQQDMPLTFFASLAFYALARFITGDGWRWTYLFWASLALGLLARGPQAVVFPLAVAVITLLLIRRSSKGSPWPSVAAPLTRDSTLPSIIRHLLLGATLFGLIGAPWFIHQYMEHGWPIIDLLLGTGQARFLSDLDRGGPRLLHFWAYIPLLMVAFLPWSGWILPGVWYSWRRLSGGLRTLPGAGADDGYAHTHTAHEERRALVGIILFSAWFLVAFLLPFLIQWRVIRYLLPALPPLAVLAALAVHAAGPRSVRTAAWLSLLVAVPTGVVVVAVYAGAFPEEQAVYGAFLMPFLVALSVAMAAFVALALTRRHHAALISLVVGTLVAYAALFYSLGKYGEQLLPAYAAARFVHGRSEPVVIADSPAGASLAFHLQQQLPRSPYPPTDAPSLLNAHGALLLVGLTPAVQALAQQLDVPADVVWKGDGFTIVRAVRPAPDAAPHLSPAP